MRQNLINRFRYLLVFELLNALVVLPFFLWLMSRNFSISVFTMLAAGSACLLLIIGAAFAFLKYRDLRHNTQRLNQYVPYFRLLRWFIPVGLVVVLLVALVHWRAIDAADQIADLFLGVLVYMLALLEYINYFHVQLMYDNRRDLTYLLTNWKLKRGLMAREFGW